MPLVTLDTNASHAVKSVLSERGMQGPVRIEVQFIGCCDPSLGLIVDAVRESDLVMVLLPVAEGCEPCGVPSAASLWLPHPD
jgi:hypothetical protein